MLGCTKSPNEYDKEACLDAKKVSGRCFERECVRACNLTQILRQISKTI